MCLSILLSLSAALLPSCVPRSSPLPHHRFSAVIASLILFLSLSLSLFSDPLWECYLYSNNPRRVEQSRTERWREFDLPKWASPQKHNKTLSLHLCFHYSASVSSPHHNFQQKHCSLRDAFAIMKKPGLLSGVFSFGCYPHCCLDAKAPKWVTAPRSHKCNYDSKCCRCELLTGRGISNAKQHQCSANDTKTIRGVKVQPFSANMPSFWAKDGAHSRYFHMHSASGAHSDAARWLADTYWKRAVVTVEDY